MVKLNCFHSNNFLLVYEKFVNSEFNGHLRVKLLEWGRHYWIRDPSLLFLDVFTHNE